MANARLKKDAVPRRSVKHFDNHFALLLVDRPIATCVSFPMSSPAAPTAFTRNIFRRFRRNRRGSAIIEFALVAPVFIALLFAILRYTRLGVRIRAGTLDLEMVSALIWLL